MVWSALREMICCIRRADLAGQSVTLRTLTAARTSSSGSTLDPHAMIAYLLRDGRGEDHPVGRQVEHQAGG